MLDSMPSAPESVPPAPQARAERAARPNTPASAGLAIWSARSLTVAGLALIWASFSQVWWLFKLYAPQYPHGLSLTISLRGVGGDAREIGMLNHYIGMAPLEEAAAFERAAAGYAVAVLMAAVIGLMFVRSRWAGWLAAGSAAALPIGFVVDAWVWLYVFGHHMDRHAPLQIPAFTPQLFGNGAIGQFMTFATPQLGFWLAAAASVLLVVAAFLRGARHE